MEEISLSSWIFNGSEWIDPKRSVARPQAEAPAYSTLERSFMHSFSGMPRLETPTSVANPDRVFQLRIYESPSTGTAATKVHMFNSEEIPIFRENGLHPVFFGETLSALTSVGTALPSLTYLLSFEDEAAKDAAWDSFRNAPEWKELSGRPEYADSKLIRKITDIALRPAAFSQL